MRRTRIVAIAAGIGIAIAAFAAPSAQKLLPTKAEVKPWAPAGGSLTVVKMDKLEELYNGGANVYREHGVQEAAQQLYQRSADVMEVTVMAIDTPANARKFYDYWKKPLKGRVAAKSARSEAFIGTKNPVTGYVYGGKYLVTVVPSYSGSKAQKDTEIFLKSLSKKLEKAK